MTDLVDRLCACAVSERSDQRHGLADTLIEAAHVVERQTAEIKRLTPPCDSGCSYQSGPAEDCSLHGRPVREVWEIVSEIQAQRDAAIARLTPRQVTTVEELLALPVGSVVVGNTGLAWQKSSYTGLGPMWAVSGSKAHCPSDELARNHSEAGDIRLWIIYSPEEDR